MEEGLFPHQLSINEPGRLEEERRLCYVGMTRAMQSLCISHAESRRLHGQDTYPTPSRFLGEVPAELLQEVRAKPKITRPVYVAPVRKPPVDDAQSVTHHQLRTGAPDKTSPCPPGGQGS